MSTQAFEVLDFYREQADALPNGGEVLIDVQLLDLDRGVVRGPLVHFRSIGHTGRFAFRMFAADGDPTDGSTTLRLVSSDVIMAATIGEVERRVPGSPWVRFALVNQFVGVNTVPGFLVVSPYAARV